MQCLSAKQPTLWTDTKYTENYDEYTAYINKEVSKYSILQNTGFILKELSNLANRRDYYTAILLVDSQIKMLQEYLAEKHDDAIEKDIEHKASKVVSYDGKT
jgi:gluconate kinase